MCNTAANPSRHNYFTKRKIEVNIVLIFISTSVKVYYFINIETKHVVTSPKYISTLKFRNQT